MIAVNNDLCIVDNPDVRRWNDFVRTRNGHVLQSTAWAELKSRFGWSAQRLALQRGDTLVAGAQILFRRLPFGLIFAYIPRGPVANPQDHTIFSTLLDALCAAAREHSSFVLKIELNARANTEPNLPLAIRNLLSANPIQPRTTIHVDLTRDLDTILTQMKPKWRYNIRLAERKGVTVRPGRADDIATFYRLLRVTGKRDTFAIHSEEYYKAAFDSFTAQDSARLFVAEYAGEALAAIFVTVFGDESIYLYGASGNHHRDRMPNHALHWHAIQWAKARGCTRYDLWGIADTAWAEAPVNENVAPNGDAPLPHGLFQFKQGFGGEVVRYAGAYDVVFSHWRYALYLRALVARRGAMG